jgi:hypothetical protein
MSWDISVQDLPLDARTVADIPDNFRPGPIGTRDEVIERIKHIFPQVNFSDKSWGMLDEPGLSVEFNMGAESISTGFMMHVRGGGDAAAAVARLLKHLQLRAFDLQTGDFFSLEAAQASFKEWQAYRDRVIPKVQANGTDLSTSSG